jgi:ubiquinone/menaquinone biosynthesis C-methylase UbiE
LFQNPRSILEPFVRDGMTVFEPGPGMGFFTLEMARMVGKSGRVVAVDIQAQMIESLARKAKRRGLASRLDLRLASSTGMGINDLTGKTDFILAFAMVHELPDASHFFKESFAALKPGGRLLFSEPSNHIKKSEFIKSLDYAKKVGFKVESMPTIRSNQSVVLRK